MTLRLCFTYWLLPLVTLHAEPAVAQPAAPKPLWPVVFGMTLLVLFTMPIMLRSLWPMMKRKTAWLIAFGAALVFLLILSPAAVSISNELRMGAPDEKPIGLTRSNSNGLPLDKNEH